MPRNILLSMLGVAGVVLLSSCGTTRTTITREHSRDSTTVTMKRDTTVHLKGDTVTRQNTITPVINTDGTISQAPDTVNVGGIKVIEKTDHNKKTTTVITPPKDITIHDAIRQTTTVIRDKTVEKKEEVKQPGFFEKLRYYSTGIIIGLVLAVIAGIVWYIRKRVPI